MTRYTTVFGSIDENAPSITDPGGWSHPLHTPNGGGHMAATLMDGAQMELDDNGDIQLTPPENRPYSWLGTPVLDDDHLPAHPPTRLLLRTTTGLRRPPRRYLVRAGGWCAPSEVLYDLVGDAADEPWMFGPREAEPLLDGNYMAMLARALGEADATARSFHEYTSLQTSLQPHPRRRAWWAWCIDPLNVTGIGER